ncbi:MAG: hypothetical protein HC869_02130 [Rhodospirillales bacterium]|nr:hypothetical protein [Rhodospirillales bacterium]
MARTGRSKAIYAYAWDLADEGVAEVAARLRDVGADSIALATAYHAGKFIRPHGRSGKVLFPEDGAIFFRHRPERYGSIQPQRSRVVEELDVLAELRRLAPDLGRVGWTVCCHNTRLGTLHPEAVSRTCFGDPLVYSLNPAHPDVRKFIIALCRDLAEQYALDALALETPGWLPWEHGYHHEFQLLPLNEWLAVLLGLDFSPATLAAARARGIDAEPLRVRTAAAIESWLAVDLHLEADRARDWLLAELVAVPEWPPFLAWRCQCVADLVAEVRAPYLLPPNYA